MTYIFNKDHEINGWKSAESFSKKAFLLRLELNSCRKQIEELERQNEELKAEVQRLSQIAGY